MRNGGSDAGAAYPERGMRKLLDGGFISVAPNGIFKVTDMGARELLAE